MQKFLIAVADNDSSCWWLLAIVMFENQYFFFSHMAAISHRGARNDQGYWRSYNAIWTHSEVKKVVQRWPPRYKPWRENTVSRFSDTTMARTTKKLFLFFYQALSQIFRIITIFSIYFENFLSFYSTVIKNFSSRWWFSDTKLQNLNGLVAQSVEHHLSKLKVASSYPAIPALPGRGVSVVDVLLRVI